MVKRIFFAINFLVVIVSCSNKKKIWKEKNFSSFSLLPSKYQDCKYYDPQFGVHLVKLEEQCFLIYLDSALQISFRDFEDTSVNSDFKIDFSQTVSHLGYYSIRISGMNLYLLDISNRKLIKYLLRGKNIVKENSYDFENLFDWNYFSFRFQYNNCFEVDSPYLYLPYAISKPEENYLDSTAYFRIGLENDKPNYYIKDKILFYPKRFKKDLLRSTYAILNKFNDSCFILGFENSDSLYLYNSKGNRVSKGIQFEGSSSFRSFKKSKSNDLSYIRWYDLTSEVICKILVNSQGDILTVKRQEREKLTSKIAYEFYLLNRTLNITGHSVFTHSVNPDFCFSYKKGFLVFNEDLTRTYYYEN
ncbi:MAG: hypothetical protein HZB42_15730 [Sphingobacteriales bacterium]|nr:hypothetical protein [Sphingobacteriales bacterium]